MVVILPRGGSVGPRTAAGSRRPSGAAPRRSRPVSRPGRPGLAAQHRRLTRQRFIQLTLTFALEDPGDLGQQVGPAARQLPQGGHRGGFLVAAQLTPPCPVTRLAVKLGAEQPVSFRLLIDHAFWHRTPLA
jgi:hypothetical protein